VSQILGAFLCDSFLYLHAHTAVHEPRGRDCISSIGDQRPASWLLFMSRVLALDFGVRAGRILLVCAASIGDRRPAAVRIYASLYALDHRVVHGDRSLVHCRMRGG
jgi:hypothetical protein